MGINRQVAHEFSYLPTISILLTKHFFVKENECVALSFYQDIDKSNINIHCLANCEIFSECEFGRWGMDCANECKCSDDGSDTCDKVRGCLCKSGYTGYSCEVDIDECEQSPNICGDRQQCVNKTGSYVCECRQGFIWNNQQCIGT